MPIPAWLEDELTRPEAFEAYRRDVRVHALVDAIRATQQGLPPVGAEEVARLMFRFLVASCGQFDRMATEYASLLDQCSSRTLPFAGNNSATTVDTPG